MATCTALTIPRANDPINRYVARLENSAPPATTLLPSFPYRDALKELVHNALAEIQCLDSHATNRRSAGASSNFQYPLQSQLPVGIQLQHKPRVCLALWNASAPPRRLGSQALELSCGGSGERARQVAETEAGREAARVRSASLQVRAQKQQRDMEAQRVFGKVRRAAVRVGSLHHPHSRRVHSDVGGLRDLAVPKNLGGTK